MTNWTTFTPALVSRSLLFVLVLLGLALAPLAIHTSGHAQEVDIEEIFWCEEAEEEGDLTLDECAEARDTLLFNCTACHTFVPIVKAEKTEEEWAATFDVHRDRLSDLSDEEFELIQRYVVGHFNPDQPVPELPPELEEQGSNQAF